MVGILLLLSFYASSTKTQAKGKEEKEEKIEILPPKLNPFNFIIYHLAQILCSLATLWCDDGRVERQLIKTINLASQPSMRSE